jgi:hypothetical protein
MTYVYLGDHLTDARLVGRQCDPVRRSDGKCIVGKSKQLVDFDDGVRAVVLRRRLRKLKRLETASKRSEV